MKSFMHTITRTLFITSIVLASHSSLAANEFTIPTIFTLSAGPAWSNATNNQTLILADEIIKTYTTDHGRHVSSFAEIFVGMQRPLTPLWQAQFGIALRAYSGASITGEIWDDADPEFNNFNYQYRISHSALALKGKFIRDFGWRVHPWISVSLGLGLNRSYNFNNTPKIVEAIENPNFANKTVTAFTYALGIGLQQRMTCNYHIGMGYEFSDWGRSKLGKATGQTTNNLLSRNHFYTHSVVVMISYDREDR